MRKQNELQELLNEWGDEQADVTAEYVKLDDDYKELQGKYDDLFDNVAELKREIVRLQVIITYLEGKK
jgi:predicted nuclease with TOPRIM domain